MNAGLPSAGALPNFAPMVAKARHDLRNPIGQILGFGEMLLEEARALGFEPFVADLDLINQCANDLIGQVNHTLDVQNIATGQSNFQDLKLRLRTLSSQITAAADKLAHLSRALKDDVFSVDLARIAAASRQMRELAETSLAFLTELGHDLALPAEDRSSLDGKTGGGPVLDVLPPPSQGGSILVVDDLEENRELLLRRLSRMGYTVHLAENGRKALEFLAKQPVDLTLLDIMMPEMDGFQTLKCLKENAPTRDIPVVMLSSTDDINTVVRCIKMGADDFLPKPFNATLLTARIESSLAKKRLREIRQSETAFYFDKGTLQPNSPSYVERQADRDLFHGLAQGEFCYVLTSRQMGKSSLMVRTANKLREQGIAVVALDLTAIGLNLTPEQWYDGLAVGIGRQLRLEDEMEDFWLDHKRLSPVQRLFTALREVVLKIQSRSVVLFVDELDTVRSLPFPTDEFFAAIRECYNRRAGEPEFSRLTFCLLGVATPSDLIRDPRVTPFNIGRRIDLIDFTTDEAAPLADGLGHEKTVAAALLQRILHWTNGHPYLTQRFCRAISRDSGVTKPANVDRLCQNLFLSDRAREEDDNLVFVNRLLLRSDADLGRLLNLYAEIRHRRKKIRDHDGNPLISILRLSGIVRNVEGRLLVRNRIYFQVFDQNWVRSHLERQNSQRPETESSRSHV